VQTGSGIDEGLGSVSKS